MTASRFPLLSLITSGVLLLGAVVPAEAQQGRASASARIGVDVGVSAGAGADHRRRVDDRDYRYDDGYDDGYYAYEERRPQPGRRFVGGIIGGALGVAGDATRGALSIAGDATRGSLGLARDATRGSLGLARDVTHGTLGAVAGRSQGRVLPRGQAGAGVDVRVGVGVNGRVDGRQGPYVYRQPQQNRRD